MSFTDKAVMKLSLRLRRVKKTAATVAGTTEKSPRNGFREVFRRLDSDGDGRISSEELQSFLAWPGDHVSPEEAAAVLRDLDADRDGLIDYEEFVRLLKSGSEPGVGSEREYEEDLRRAFKMFEGEGTGGCITAKGLQRVLGKLGESRTEEECAAMIRAYDLDGNGVLDYHEFHRMMG